MGYESKYTLFIESTQDDEYLEAIRDEMKRLGGFARSLDLDGGGAVRYDSRDPVKWYEHREDLEVLSKKFRGTIFVLRRSGEDQGDLEVYALNGVVESIKAEVWWPDVPLYIKTARRIHSHYHRLAKKGGSNA